LTFITAESRRHSFATLAPVAALKAIRKRSTPVAGFFAWSRPSLTFSAAHEACESATRPEKGAEASCYPHPGGGLGKAARFVLLEPAIAEEKPDIMLSQLAESLPHEIEVAGRLGVAAALERLAGEVQRRIDKQVLDGETVFLVIRDLGRFRELRKEEGGFMVDGRSFQVSHPDSVMVSPTGRTAIIFEPNDSYSVVDLMLMNELGVPPPKATG